MKIIVVDDEITALQAFLSEIIGEDGVEYKFFKDSERDIIDYVCENNTDAAFLDIAMPNINGVELARKLIGLNRKIKIVFITGSDIKESDLPTDVAQNTSGFLYKPYDSAVLTRLLSEIRERTRVLKVKAFGSFDCFIDGKIVRFSSAKSKELFALLIAYNGKSLTMSDAISQLWSDMEIEKSKKLYRDAVWRLRKTLSDICFPCVEFQRALLFLDRSDISCDYWDFLSSGKGEYAGEFMKSYDWSVDYLALLDEIGSR